MCLQCIADAQHVFKGPREILPASEYGGPFYLVKARGGCKDWPKGWYGLVRMNDPDIIWEWDPQPEPTVESEDWKIWCREIEKICEDFIFDPMLGFHFVGSCKKAGYDPDRDGYNVVLWFMDHVGRALRDWDIATEADWRPPTTAWEGYET